MGVDILNSKHKKKTFEFYEFKVKCWLIQMRRLFFEKRVLIFWGFEFLCERDCFDVSL